MKALDRDNARSTKIDIIIVNWNAGFHIVQALCSIADYGGDFVRSVIIVDNASTDGSMAAVHAHAKVLDLPMQYIANTRNLGFAAACNQGARLATSDIVLFMNPDVQLFAGSLRTPVAYLTSPIHSDVGAVGIQLVDRNQTIARSCARFPSFTGFLLSSFALTRLPLLRRLDMHMGDWTHDSTRDVDHVIGAFLMIRKSVFDRLRGFDERFFVYLEDLDLSLRLRRARQRIVYLTQAQAFHLGGGTSHQVKAHRLFYSLRSRLLYAAKHFSPWQAQTLFATTLLAEPITRLAGAVIKGRFGDAKKSLQAFRMLYRDAPTLWANVKGRP